MFIPLHDRNGLKYIRMQWVTWTLIALNVVIYVLTLGISEGSDFSQAAILGLGFIPSVVNDVVELPPGYALVQEDLTYVTYSFLHGNFMHLASNMLFLWVFGDNIEDAMGHFRFLVFYLACAAGGASVHALLLPESQSPLIGASGAIAGIVAAYLILHPRVRLWVLAFGRFPLPLPAWIPLIAWIAYQFFMLLAEPDSEIAWGAHAGGIITGAVLVFVLRRRGVALFDRRIETPRAVVRKEPPAAVPAGKDSPVHWGR